jgi:Predicted periplasmic solute-binding protein
MNKKYLLRGIGIGIIIGVAIMFAAWKTGGDASGGKATTEAVTRAATEEATEAVTEKQTEATTEKATEAATEKKTEATTEKVTEATTEATTEKVTEATTEKVTEATTEKATEATTEKKTEESTEETTEKATEEKTEETTEKEDKKDSKGNITVEVTSGMGSEDIAAALQEKGIIKDADEFNTFLITNGYDAQLGAGSFSLKPGDTFENIVKILTTEGE